MAAKLKLESLSARQGRPNTRRVNRMFSHSDVAIRSSQGDRKPAQLRDVSIFGCSIKCDADWLRNGIFLSIDLTSNWSVQAVVRWLRNGVVGVEFLRPISESQAETISVD